MKFLIDQKVSYDEHDWKIAGTAHTGKYITGLWLVRHERTGKDTEAIEIYIRKKELSKVRVR